MGQRSHGSRRLKLAVHVDSTCLGPGISISAEAVAALAAMKELGIELHLYTDLRDCDADRILAVIVDHGIDPETFGNELLPRGCDFVVDGRCVCESCGFRGWTFVVAAMTAVVEDLSRAPE